MEQKETAFVALIKEHEGLLFKVSTIYTDHKMEQQDLFQEIVYQLWKSFDSFKNQSKISTWMYRVAMNTAIGQLKRKKRSPISESIEKVVLKQMESQDPVFEERLKLMYEHIGKLNVLEKGLILLLLEGKSYQEIAAISGLTTSNVGTRISRIKQKLKGQLNKK
ncbi:MAG: sigma-70 family RNA polymerase sigma factor [Croceitalea sp.]|nr:sigma-70 family RNA polymerase sigma factor [Croceitalea sp.]NNC35796.1 sigma-70 family RNA polymerase sigma factor [Croceitalea sp.]